MLRRRGGADVQLAGQLRGGLGHVERAQHGGAGASEYNRQRLVGTRCGHLPQRGEGRVEQERPPLAVVRHQRFTSPHGGGHDRQTLPGQPELGVTRKWDLQRVAAPGGPRVQAGQHCTEAAGGEQATAADHVGCVGLPSPRPLRHEKHAVGAAQRHPQVAPRGPVPVVQRPYPGRRRAVRRTHQVQIGGHRLVAGAHHPIESLLEGRTQRVEEQRAGAVGRHQPEQRHRRGDEATADLAPPLAEHGWVVVPLQRGGGQPELHQWSRLGEDLDPQQVLSGEVDLEHVPSSSSRDPWNRQHHHGTGRRPRSVTRTFSGDGIVGDVGPTSASVPGPVASPAQKE